MLLQQTHLTPALAQEAKAIYLEAFPKEERLPWWLLRLNATRKGIDITAWTEEGQLRGITVSVTDGGLHFLLFFAIHPQYRGQGYGSAILEALWLPGHRLPRLGSGRHVPCPFHKGNPGHTGL